MNLRYLLNPWIQKYIPNIEIFGLKLNSKLVKYGDIFFSILGYNIDGRYFINEAINNGSFCILLETNFINDHGNIIYKNHIPIIFFYNLKKYISVISGNFYNHPSKKINIIGVTGTNGKTTVTYLISKWLSLLGKKSAIIGTLGNGFLNNLKKTINTTDSALDMQKQIYEFKSLGVDTIISEISSHSISQYRIKSINFRSAILTNISNDHLDFHKNFENYKKSKLSFFMKHKILSIIINMDNKLCREIFNNVYNISSIFLNKKNIIYSKNWIYVNKIIENVNNTYIFFNSNFGNNKLKINFIGKFNINNLLLSMITLLDLGYKLLDLVKTSKYLNLPIGRMETFNYKDNKKIIIDYAHTPDAIKNVLKTINNIYKKKKIWSVFGCGGDRDYKKRSIMGYIAEKYSYKVIITNDNPRSENPKFIINDILKKIFFKKNIKIILNRKYAIKYAIYNSSHDDIIIIFGKGHEDYQIFKKKTILFSDIEIVKNIIYNNCD